MITDTRIFEVTQAIENFLYSRSAVSYIQGGYIAVRVNGLSSDGKQIYFEAQFSNPVLFRDREVERDEWSEFYKIDIKYIEKDCCLYERLRDMEEHMEYAPK